jgi:hypothetical protein
MVTTYPKNFQADLHLGLFLNIFEPSNGRLMAKKQPKKTYRVELMRSNPSPFFLRSHLFFPNKTSPFLLSTHHLVLQKTTSTAIAMPWPSRKPRRCRECHRRHRVAVANRPPHRPQGQPTQLHPRPSDDGNRRLQLLGIEMLGI